jgi:hypothetical protein
VFYASNIYVPCYMKYWFSSCKYLQVWRPMFRTMHLRRAVTMSPIGCIEMKHASCNQNHEEKYMLTSSPILKCQVH